MIIDPSTLLRGKLSVKDWYMGKEFPEPTGKDISEFENYKSTLKMLFDVGIFVSVDENTIGAVNPTHLLMKKYNEMMARNVVETKMVNVMSPNYSKADL